MIKTTQSVSTSTSHNYLAVALAVCGQLSWMNVHAAQTGMAGISHTITPGNALVVTVTDADLNTDPASKESVVVSVRNTVSGEQEQLALMETEDDSGIFSGSLATVLGPAGTDNDGVLPLQPKNTAQLDYNDAVTAEGGTNTVTAVANALGGADFFSNFLSPAFYVPIFPIAGSQLGGDLNTIYHQIYVPHNPNWELLIFGEYPPSRYFALTTYDDHEAVIDNLHDTEIVPLEAGEENPFLTGTPNEDVLYGVRVQMGEQLVSNPLPGCQTTDLNIDNLLDARFRHTAATLYSPYQSNFSVLLPEGVTVTHDDSTVGRGISIIVRRTLTEDDGDAGNRDLTLPLVFIRDVTTGCAVNMYELLNRPQPTPASIAVDQWYAFPTVINRVQSAAHYHHELAAGNRTPFGLDPQNSAAWYGGPEYIRANNADTGYLISGIPARRRAAMLNLDGRIMRLRFRLPQTPCLGFLCPLNDEGDMRYWSMSFIEGAKHTFATIADRDLVPDANGYVTLIVSFGTALPPRINASNGYSVMQLPEVAARQIAIRNIIPQAEFPCPVTRVPFYTNEHNTDGGYLGEYAPFVDYPIPANLPLRAIPRVESGTCSLSQSTQGNGDGLLNNLLSPIFSP